ncbi:MAG: DUF2163 domain-containing protein [Acinetobacter populi]|jgi:uncharacterized phage protein (TIGR02218 family)|uniref:DUF2163 domain-containing protein n=1 Tax=Acinetobacter populi TaxID=1582270 RepID=UPI00235455B8|nr:DUF2163 domain-containing protein [Acinetobacter populi]MCH4247585.1 DUF2163 domain-containing protein [Acinetobacter populi]
MRQVSDRLKALLAGNQFVMAELYTIQTTQGNIYRYTNYDYHLTVGGFLYRSDGPIIERDSLSYKVGIELDSLSVTVLVNDDVMLGSLPFLQAVHNGQLDGARFKLERVFIDIANPFDNGAETIKLFEGLIVEPDFTRNNLEFSVKSDLDVLDVQMPRDLWQPGCKNTLFDAGCGLSREEHAVMAIVEAGSNLNRIVCSLNQPQGYFTQGVVQFSQGINQGIKRTIRLHESGSLLLTLPLLELPAVGEQISVYPGCDKRSETCDNRFNNLNRFRGEPFIPVPETAV